MKKVNINFFGEKVEINMPTSLQSLKQSISDQFLFSPSDAAELIIGYMKNLGNFLMIHLLKYHLHFQFLILYFHYMKVLVHKSYDRNLIFYDFQLFFHSYK